MQEKATLKGENLHNESHLLDSWSHPELYPQTIRTPQKTCISQIKGRSNEQSVTLLSSFLLPRQKLRNVTVFSQCMRNPTRRWRASPPPPQPAPLAAPSTTCRAHLSTTPRRCRSNRAPWPPPPTTTSNTTAPPSTTPANPPPPASPPPSRTPSQAPGRRCSTRPAKRTTTTTKTTAWNVTVACRSPSSISSVSSSLLLFFSRPSHWSSGAPASPTIPESPCRFVGFFPLCRFRPKPDRIGRSGTVFSFVCSKSWKCAGTAFSPLTKKISFRRKMGRCMNRYSAVTASGTAFFLSQLGDGSCVVSFRYWVLSINCKASLKWSSFSLLPFIAFHCWGRAKKRNLSQHLGRLGRLVRVGHVLSCIIWVQ